MAAVLKTASGSNPTWVRIPRPPLRDLAWSDATVASEVSRGDLEDGQPHRPPRVNHLPPVVQHEPHPVPTAHVPVEQFRLDDRVLAEIALDAHEQPVVADLNVLRQPFLGGFPACLGPAGQEHDAM